MTKDLQCYYDGERDTWIVKVPFALPASTLERVRERVFKVNHDRMMSCLPGDKKDYLKRALDALTQGRLEQLVTNKGEQVMFSSTVRENPDRVFSFGEKP